MSRFMTRMQYQRHVAAVRACEDKLDIARKKVGKAAEHGDLSENAEYEAAVEESGFLAGRLEELRSVTIGTNVVDPRNTDPDIVSLGKTVRIRDEETAKEVVYHIVGTGVTQTDAGEVSYTAPLGAALVASRIDDVVTAKLPSGTRQYRVLEISYYED